MATLATAAFFSTAALADVALSGYYETLFGSADQSKLLGSADHGIDKAGMSDGNYSRINADMTTQLDNGIDVAIHMTWANDCIAGTTGICGVGIVNSQDMTFSGGFGSISVGNTAGAGQRMHSRLTAGVPTAEPDGGNIGQFYTADSNTYGSTNELGYASNASGITFMSNSYEGFTLGVNYAPNMVETVSGDGDNGQVNTYTSHQYNDRTEIIVKYDGEFDGVGVTATYGNITGNAGRLGDVDYNDANSNTVSLQLRYAGLSVDHRWHDASDSGLAKNGGAGGNQSNSTCGKYVSGAFSVGACRVEADYDPTVTTTNSSETNTLSAGYNLGGGVNSGVVFFNVDQTAATTTRTDVSGIMGILSVGF